MLLDLISEDLIVTGLKSKEKEGVIDEMCKLFAKSGIVEKLDEFIEAIRKREKIESTGIGEGIAIPHARSNSVKGLVMAFGHSEEGVDFEALDGKPVHLIFMIAAPHNVQKEYLQAVAGIARLLRIREFKQRLLESRTKVDVLEVVKEFDARHSTRVAVKTKKGRAVYGE